MKKKKPNNRWITGRQRAQMQKMQRWLKSIPVANNKEPPGQQPMTMVQLADFNAVFNDIAVLLALKS